MELSEHDSRLLQELMLSLAMKDDGLMARIMMQPPTTDKGEE